MKRKIISYNPKLKEYARQLRNNSTKCEVILWKKLKRKQMFGYDFHRQKPLLNYIADFYCYELNLVIEVDGYSHQFVETQKKDARKQLELENIGLALLRFTDEEVKKQMVNVLNAIENYILEYEKQQF
jgi:very-short-patch-repair endonuclease